MDYSPTPSKVKPQYAFLDNSIEQGRSAAGPRAFRGSPLKNQKDTESFHQRQKQFYNKYNDLPGTPDILKEKQKARANTQVYTDTTSRLFKNISNKVPVDDVVKINSNMIEKIIRENESLKNQLKGEVKENELLSQFAKGVKEKLIKYKTHNDELQVEIEKLKSEKVEIEKKIQAATTPPESPKYNFNPDNVDDILGSNEKDLGTTASSIDPQPSVASSKIEERIINLEAQVCKINTNQDEKFEYIKNEIEFLKNLSLQMKKKPESDDEDEEKEEKKDLKHRLVNEVPKEDDLIVKESLELKQLQDQVDLFTKKLQLREENKIKKYTLNKELEKLAQRLQQAEIPNNSRIDDEPEELHTPINQTSPYDKAGMTSSKSSRGNPVQNTVRERLNSECKVCDKSPDTPPHPTRSNENEEKPREHVPSFKIGDTVWY